MDIPATFNTQLAIIGNFPYNISSQIVFKILENKDHNDKKHLQNYSYEFYNKIELDVKNGNPKFFIEIKDKQQQNTFSEYLRLLYVAMTRAEDHLVICGYSNTQKEIPEILILRNYTEFGIVLVSMVAIGIFITSISTLFAVSRYLRLKIYDLYR